MHPNGFDVRELPNGFVFQEAAAVRTPLRVAVGRGDAVIPAEHATKDLPSGTIRFWLEKEPAGSGGPLWRLVGVVAVKNGLNIVMEASQQHEGGPPGFQRAWTIFQSVQEE